MNETASADRSPRAPFAERRRPPHPIELWRLRGATDDLRGLAIETSFGYGLGLELDAELILLYLQPNLESVVAYANRIESALVAQGWQVIEERPGGRRGHDPR
jgi:hypothetical protein